MNGLFELDKKIILVTWWYNYKIYINKDKY